MADVRILLTDKAIARLPAPKDGWYLTRDTEPIRVAIGDASVISTRTARATAKDYLAQISRGQHPKSKKLSSATGEPATPREVLPPLRDGLPSGRPGCDTETPT